MHEFKDYRIHDLENCKHIAMKLLRHTPVTRMTLLERYYYFRDVKPDIEKFQRIKTVLDDELIGKIVQDLTLDLNSLDEVLKQAKKHGLSESQAIGVFCQIHECLIDTLNEDSSDRSKLLNFLAQTIEVIVDKNPDIGLLQQVFNYRIKAFQNAQKGFIHSAGCWQDDITRCLAPDTTKLLDKIENHDENLAAKVKEFVETVLNYNFRYHASRREYPIKILVNVIRFANKFSNHSSSEGLVNQLPEYRKNLLKLMSKQFMFAVQATVQAKEPDTYSYLLKDEIDTSNPYWGLRWSAALYGRFIRYINYLSQNKFVDDDYLKEIELKTLDNLNQLQAIYEESSKNLDQNIDFISYINELIDNYDPGDQSLVSSYAFPSYETLKIDY